MSKLFRNTLLLAIIQPVPLTAALPTAADNAILASVADPKPVVAETVERNNVQPFLGNKGKVVTAVHSEVSFEVELQGSGVAGTAPKFGPLLRGCALGETIVASTSVAYSPVTTGHEALTIHWYMDGIRHLMTDAKGTVAFTLNAKGIPVMKYTFTGLYSTPTDTAMPSGANFAGFLDPKPVNKQNTTTFSLHGYTASVESFDLDLANQVVYTNRPNSESIRITERTSTGRIVMEHPDTIAAKNWADSVVNNIAGALSIVHGSGAGKIVEFSGPKLIPRSMDFSDQDGIAMVSLDLDVMPNAGNDEFIVTFK
ncbi:hypothetical protein LG204_10255 [Methylovorus menthalis]|uniref:phage tail tube protein n=1 Tax=Methylovorus menthalis TaxID=1002227 RepID=UPI001E498BA9|nr:phage tail tube protein [Methylovorus menthalis]MCB4811696.1 hypothetical protein [Methylovorus menthalis]